MKRRAAIARALAVNADLLLLDEPFTGIDPALRERIAGLLRQRAGSALLVLVTHIEEEAWPSDPASSPLPAPAWTAPIPVRPQTPPNGGVLVLK